MTIFSHDFFVFVPRCRRPVVFFVGFILIKSCQRKYSHLMSTKALIKHVICIQEHHLRCLSTWLRWPFSLDSVALRESVTHFNGFLGSFRFKTESKKKNLTNDQNHYSRLIRGLNCIVNLKTYWPWKIEGKIRSNCKMYTRFVREQILGFINFNHREEK